MHISVLQMTFLFYPEWLLHWLYKTHCVLFPFESLEVLFSWFLHGQSAASCVDARENGKKKLLNVKEITVWLFKTLLAHITAHFTPAIAAHFMALIVSEIPSHTNTICVPPQRILPPLCTATSDATALPPPPIHLKEDHTYTVHHFQPRRRLFLLAQL